MALHPSIHPAPGRIYGRRNGEVESAEKVRWASALSYSSKNRGCGEGGRERERKKDGDGLGWCAGQGL